MDLNELDERIREVIRDDPDVKRVAQKVLANLSAADQRDLVALLLPAHVRNVMTESHRRVPRPPDQPRRGRTQAAFVGLDKKKYASVKRRDLVDWQLITGASIASPSGRKFFGEFTVEEITWLAAQRTAQAQTLLRQADRYRDIARVMVMANVQRVQDLDRKVLLSLMRDSTAEGAPVSPLSPRDQADL
jgi:hypothetical protein